jgi:hypothetical protein
MRRPVCKMRWTIVPYQFPRFNPQSSYYPSDVLRAGQILTSESRGYFGVSFAICLFSGKAALFYFLFEERPIRGEAAVERQRCEQAKASAQRIKR